MSLIAFELSMPRNNSWNGRWSGDAECFAIVRNIRAKKSIPELTSYGYNFGDGWFARVDVREVSAAEARRLRKASKGFCGYNWMIDSIIWHGEIRTN